VLLSLENAMAMYWKAISFQLVASCVDDGETFSIDTTLTTNTTVDELICGVAPSFGNGGNDYISMNTYAYSQGELYVPSFYMVANFQRIMICTSDQNYGVSGSISFQGISFGADFFNDDTGKFLSGSGSLTIIAERTFE